MSYRNYIKPIILGFSIIICLLFCTFTAVMADEHAAEAETTSEAEATEEASEGDAPVQLESLVVVGTRARPRSVLESAVPIDIVSKEDFVKQGGADLTNLLRTVVPSYNINTQPISDAGTVVRPANLRGLAPDQTLVLVNNKRRHRAAVIHWLGNGLADGAQGPDLSPIPSIALKQVEVLRDGASAQYGSDAIAGVLNFQLKDDYEGGSFEFKPGIYQYGDGQQFAIAGNIGLGNPDTWTNLSVEYGGADPTIRSVQRTDALALVEAGNLNVKDPAQIWGQPIVNNDFKLFANYGSTITDTINFYGHANYASKRVEGGFYFRNPNTRSGVFGRNVDLDDDDKPDEFYLLVGNLSGLPEGVDKEADDIQLAHPETGAVTAVTDADRTAIANGVPADPAKLQNVIDDPNLFSYREMFPGGFTPRFGANTIDSSVLVGVKGTTLEEELGKPLTWDISGYFGRHHADFFIFNTVNASLGPETPTIFNPGDYIQTDYNLNFDVAYPLTDMVFLASGLEYRNEGFEVVSGDRESHQIGPLATQGFTAASNGFSGFSPIAAGTWNRYNIAAYLESEVRPLENWLVALAVRGENFEDFGSTLNYKVATNYGITETMKLRGSYSTGFRAPTPGQQNTFNVTTEFNFEKNDLVNNGTIPSTNPAAALVGGKQLEPETSNNFTGGFTVEILDVNLTVDFFDIRMKDRLALSQDFALQEAQKQDLIDAGVTSAANLQEFRFFTNDFDTTTQGIDAVITAPLLDGNLIAVYNFTQTTVTDHNPETLDDLRIKELEENLPKHRGSITIVQPILDDFGVLGRASYFSDWYDSEDDETYANKVIFDLEATYNAPGGLSITLGGNNILNTYPDENPKSGNIGNKYGQFSPFGFDGAFWYARFGYSF